MGGVVQEGDRAGEEYKDIQTKTKESPRRPYNSKSYSSTKGKNLNFINIQT